MDTLRPFLYESRCLDLYSGLGRFGLGALNEGASWVTFVEKNTSTVAGLKKSLLRYQEKSKVISDDAEAFLNQPEPVEFFDIVFADPPFPFWNESFSLRLQELVVPRLSAPGIFVVKSPARMLAFRPIERLSLWKTSPFGESKLIYLKYAEETKS